MIIVIIILNVALVRAVCLYTSIKSTKQLVQQRKDCVVENHTEQKITEKCIKCKLWWLNKSKKKQRVILLAPAAVITIMIIIIYIVESIVKPSAYLKKHCFIYGEFYASTWSTRIYTFFYVAAYTLISIFLRKSKDAFGIKTELNTTSLCGIIFLILLMLFYLIPELDYINENYFITIILSELMFLAFFISSIIVPLYYSYAEERLSLEDSIVEQSENKVNDVKITVRFTNFEEILYNTKGRENFGEYLEMEFAIQHLHF